jgi:UDP-glucose 4-epimerase
LPITVHRGAERSWCWVQDTVAGIVLAIEAGGGGAWNVGRDDAPVSMLSLAEQCCELTGADPDELIEMVDPPARQTVVKRLSTSKLRGIGWEPKVELSEGLPRVLEWVRRFDREGNYVVERQAA